MNKKGFTLIELLVSIVMITVVVIVISVVIVLTCVGAKTIKSVNEYGIKGSVEKVWNGPDSGVQK